MEYEILYDQAFPILNCKLKRGEKIKAESDAMVGMSNTIDVEGGIEKGLLRSVVRTLAGENLFFQYLIAKRGDGEVLFSHSIPGSIIDVELDGSYGLNIQKGGFLASSNSIDVDTKMQNIIKGMFSQEGFFILNAKGNGTVFISSYGAIHPINIDEGDEYIVDNGHIVAWPDYMDYRIEKASNGWISSIVSGEKLVCRFKGPGTVLIQTRNPSGFSNWISSMGFSKT